MGIYDKMTSDEFHEILEEIVGKMTPGALLAIGDVYVALSEHLNNDVLERWAEKQGIDEDEADGLEEDSYDEEEESLVGESNQVFEEFEKRNKVAVANAFGVPLREDEDMGKPDPKVDE